MKVANSKRKSLFRVYLRNGRTVTMTAISALNAEIETSRKWLSPITKIRFVKKVANG